MKTSPHKRDNNEVQAARGRLRGVLNDSLQNQEVDDIPEDYEEEEEEEQPAVTHRQRGRPKKLQPTTGRISPTADYLTPNKRRKREQHGGSGGQKIQAESFVMKLFDRSLDLSKYSEQTSLYPICRAWMANQPRNPSIRSYRDTRTPSPTERIENGPEIALKLRKGDLRDVTSLPKPKKTDILKIPPPIEQPKKYSKTEQVVGLDNKLKDGEKEDLLADHLGKWKQVKRNWQNHTKFYQQRYNVSFQILDQLFKP